MEENEDYQYQLSLQRRLKELLEMIGLEESGFAEFTGQSEGHIYAILNGNRNLSLPLAKLIGELLEFDGEKLFNLRYKIPERVKNASELNNFKTKFKLNQEYFLNTLIDRKRSKYIEKKLIPNFPFNRPAYLSEIRNIINEGIDITPFDSNELSKILNYLVLQNRLSKSRDFIKKKNGDFGTRKVDLFFIKNAD